MAHVAPSPAADALAGADDLDAFLRALPKAELHLHIEGTLEPELMFALAARNRFTLPFPSVEALRAAYSFSNLQDFLDIYYQGAAVLLTAEDFHDLTWAYLQRLHADGGVHAEIMVDAQTHTGRGVPWAAFMGGITSACGRAHVELGVTSRLILSALRHLPEDDALQMLREAEPHLESFTGFGLDSSELGNPPSGFQRVFRAAGERGLRLTCHAGEEGPPAYVAEALDLLGVERIDHGNRALEDAALTARLVAQGTPLTVCPLSNLKLRVVRDMGEHPLKRMLALGLRVTVNADDPAYFGGYLNANLRAVAEALALTRGELATLARNSLEASWLSRAEAAGHLQRLQALEASAD